MNRQTFKFIIMHLVLIIATGTVFGGKVGDTNKRDLDYKCGKIKSVKKVKFTFVYQGEEFVKDVVKSTMVNAAHRVLSEYSGLYIVQASADAGTDDSTVNIHIKAKVESLPKEYSVIGSSKKEIRYPILSVTGIILLENRGIVIKKAFQEIEHTFSYMVIEHDEYQHPTDIFKQQNFPDRLEEELKKLDGYYNKLFEAAVEAFGMEIIIPALKTKDKSCVGRALVNLSEEHSQEIVDKVLPLATNSDKELSSAASGIIFELVFFSFRSFDTPDLDNLRTLVKALKHNDVKTRAIATQGVADIIKGRIKNVEQLRQWRKDHERVFID